MRDLEKPAHIQQMDIEAAAQAQSEAELKNAMRRHVERMGHFKEWVKPENVKERAERAAKEAAASLAALGGPPKLLPVPDPLPKHMRGQSASTIQAMLRSGWKPDD